MFNIKFRRLIATVRRKYYTRKVRRHAKDCGENLTANFPTKVTANTTLGNNVNFNGMQIDGGGNVKIGNNFHSGHGCLLITSNHNYDHGTEIPYDSSKINKDISIGDNVWLGSQVTILGNVTIGEGAIIQAGAVVVKDIEKYAIAGGNPAKTFKYRDREHYERLKKAGKFH